MKGVHRSYKRNFCSCEKEARINPGLYGIRTLEHCVNGAAIYQLSKQASWLNRSLSWFVSTNYVILSNTYSEMSTFFISDCMFLTPSLNFFTALAKNSEIKYRYKWVQ